MAQPLPLPLPEPPAEHVAQLLDLLRAARRELGDARRVVHLLSIDDGPGPRSTRDCIELDVAQRRVDLWAAEVATIERTAQALAIDVRATL